jgi:Bifunctional DNA primase/polymerase, N-terminal./Primase C terminal 2 (PriCT-2).
VQNLFAPTFKEPFEFASNMDGALWWHAFGYRVIPVVPGKKFPAVGYNPWLNELSPEAIRQHWQKHPSHQVAAVLDETQMVLDADSPESQAVLERLENAFGVVPHLIIQTRRGYHHHFRIMDGAFCKGDSHLTAEYPERLDVRAGNNSALLTPNQDKSVFKLVGSHRDDLSYVGQDFIDAVFQHNGRRPPRPAPEIPEGRPSSSTDLTTLKALINGIDANCGYQDWLNVLMAIYHETGGSAEGFELADTWSSKGKSYQGRQEIEVKWRSFSGDVAHPITVGTLISMARDAGADTAAIVGEKFTPCKTLVVRPDKEEAKPSNPLARFSLIGRSAEYEARAQAVTPLLGDVCMKGEATVWYAKHNTGKTLLFLHMALEAIEQGKLAAPDLFYINADDSSSGIAVKLGILDELGAHTLVPGQQGFKTTDLIDVLKKGVTDDTARGTFVVIDTLKKFTNLMNKSESSVFTNVCRQYVAAGGTILVLAHVNKRKGEDGKPIYAGTSDVLDDFDAGYIINDSNLSGQPGHKVVEFSREKARTGGAASAAYSYDGRDNVSYDQRLASVTFIDPENLAGIKQETERKSDAELIATVRECITQGIVQKMALRNAVAAKANVNRASAMRVIEKYTGTDPAHHHWFFNVGARGAKCFALLGNDRTASAVN